jgi:hypothetical protein
VYPAAGAPQAFPMAEAAARLLQARAELGERGDGPLQRSVERVLRLGQRSGAAQGGARPRLVGVRRQLVERCGGERRPSVPSGRLREGAETLARRA